MATGGQKEADYSLVNVRELRLETTYDNPYYNGIVVCRDTIIVIDRDECKVQLHRLQDGKLQATHQLESKPRDICRIIDMEICVILWNGQIEIMAVNSRDMMATITSTRSLHVQSGMDRYDGVAKFKENLVVCGVKQDTICWCIVSLNDGHVDKIHQICKGDIDSHLTTKDNMIYISCNAGLLSPDSGIYGFDILNPSQPKYTYKHKYLFQPRGIAINKDGLIFVCNDGYSCIHHLTAECQLVSIYRQGLPGYLRAIFWDQVHGRLYVTCSRSNDITIYGPKCPVTDNEIEEVLIDYSHDGVREQIYQLLCRLNQRGSLNKTNIFQALKAYGRNDLVNKYSKEDFSEC